MVMLLEEQLLGQQRVFLFRCLVYAVLTCKWNSASSAAPTCLGIRESISSIDVGERDIIVMIGVYWYSRILFSDFMIL
jgi:hypothetical protein